MGQARRRTSEIAWLKGRGPKLKPGETQRQLDDICLDCNSEHCGYMVKSHVWKEAELVPSDACCCNCLEGRLERILTAEDFDWRFPVNFFLPFSFEDDEGLLLLLRWLAKNLGKPENSLDDKLEELKAARRLFPNGLTMRESTSWFQTHF